MSWRRYSLGDMVDDWILPSSLYKPKTTNTKKIKTNRILWNSVTEVSRVDFELRLAACRLFYYLIKDYLKSYLMLKHYEGTTYMKQS